MNAQAQSRHRPAPQLHEREGAALRRLETLMRAEAAELGPDDWMAERLDPGDRLSDWGERILPELSRLAAVERGEDDQPWARRSLDHRLLNDEQEGCLRRVAVLLRAEAAELGHGSPVGRRLGGWGLWLALEFEDPERSLGLV